MGPSHYPHTIFASLQEDLRQRPLMLKDFLRDDHSHSCSSSSSPIGSHHEWYPLKVSPKSNDPSNVQLLSRSKSAAMRTISAFHKVVNLVKMIPFASRSEKDIRDDSTEVIKVKVKVKDILRWTSFRDLDVGKSAPLDHLTTITTLDSSSSSSTSSSYSGRRSSSWSHSDLTADDLPFWCGENKDYFNNREDDTSRKIPKGEWAFEECDQQSPVSVLHDSLFLENEGPVSPCHASLSNTSSPHSERVVMDELEEKAKWLLSQVKETDGDARDDRLILDFFQHELSLSGKLVDLELDGKILEVAKSWKKGESEELFEWELEERRGAFVRDMEREVGWTKLSCEVQEMCEELQIEVWSELLCEVLCDFHAK